MSDILGDLETFEVKIEAVNDNFEVMEAADVNMEAIEVNYKSDFNLDQQIKELTTNPKVIKADLKSV